MLFNIGTFMSSFLLPIFLLLLSLPALAEEWTGFSDCGIYQVNGVARTTKNGLVIVVNEKTQSELIITVPILNEAKLAPYIDKALAANVVIEQKPSGPKFLATIKEIQSRIPNPLAPKDTGIKIISKVECK